jgi:tetratricopeptide (TPR) repeat protein
VSERTSWLAAHPVSPDTELADRLDELDAGGAGADLDPAQVALLAVAARRLARGGDLDGAAEVYERLRSSWFEPEAGIALARVLAGMSAAAVARGEVEQVRAIEQRRIAVGAVDSVAAGLAVAGALQADGRVDEARGEVAALLETADEAQREILHTRLGELALAEDDLEAARAAFSSALEIARNDTSGVSRVAQLETRLALVALVAGDDTAGPHVRAALEAWQEAGAFEPVWTLLEEARGLLASDTSKAVFGLAASALGALIKSFEADVDPDAVSSYLAGGASSNGEAAEGIPPGAV